MLRHRGFMLLRRLGSVPATLYEEQEGGDFAAAAGALLFMMCWLQPGWASRAVQLR